MGRRDRHKWQQTDGRTDMHRSLVVMESAAAQQALQPPATHPPSSDATCTAPSDLSGNGIDDINRHTAVKHSAQQQLTSVKS